LVKREVIMARIDKLNEYLAYLKDVSRYSSDEYVSNPLVYGSTERFLHLAIECVIDIGNHIIADMNFRKPESNKEIFEVLYENKIIDEKLLQSLIRMAQFRNILVHDYVRLNRGMVYNIVLNNLADIKSFIKTIGEYI
jgi:uncharacterized protein YutE (UPF0331/DUF86 family)